MKWKKEHKMASMNIVPYHMSPYGHPYQFDIHPSQFAHLSAQDAWHFSNTGWRLNQLYQEQYQGYQNSSQDNSALFSSNPSAETKYPQEF